LPQEKLSKLFALPNAKEDIYTLVKNPNSTTLISAVDLSSLKGIREVATWALWAFIPLLFNLLAFT
jgi:hypothetical protein